MGHFSLELYISPNLSMILSLLLYLSLHNTLQLPSLAYANVPHTTNTNHFYRFSQGHLEMTLRMHTKLHTHFTRPLPILSQTSLLKENIDSVVEKIKNKSTSTWRNFGAFNTWQQRQNVASVTQQMHHMFKGTNWFQFSLLRAITC